MMAGEENPWQEPEEPQPGRKNPSKAVKINRKGCLESADPHRKEKFNGDQRDGIKDEKKESHNGCTEVGHVSSSEKLIQEDVVSCTAERYVDPGSAGKKPSTPNGDTLSSTTPGLDENHNVQREGSDHESCNKNRQNPVPDSDPAEEQVLVSLRISQHKTDGQPPGCEGSNGEKEYEEPRDQTGDPWDSGAAEGNSGVLKEKENHPEEAPHSSKRRDQSHGADKKLKEHNEEVKKKDPHERRDKTDKNKEKERHTRKDKVKKEAENEEKTAGGSFPEKGGKDPSDKKAADAKKKHKDPSKAKEDKHKDQAGKRNHQVKEEREDPARPKENGSVLTLVDLDLFQETLTGDKRQKSKDGSKGKSRDKAQKGSDERDKRKKDDHKDPKRREEDEEVKGIKREQEEQEAEELGPNLKKSKAGPESDQKNQARSKGSSSKKRKNAGEAGDTKAKRAKEAKQKEEESKWKWWEEKNHEDGVKWKFLEHRGPYFAPLYEPLPDDVHFHYDGQQMALSPAAEEVATFYGKMLDHDYTTKEIFQKNFFTDWKSQMTKEERKTIKHLHKCDFSEIHKYFYDKNEARKALPKEEKQKLKEESSKIQEEYGFCTLDGHREKIGNFKTEPPGLFRGRGDHPKMGMLKMRIKPEDVIINCSRDSKVPDPPPGHRWKEVRYDNTVTWLASWTENIQGSIKYIMLNPSSKLKGEKDWQKYETARRLKNVVDQIRSQYRLDWKSREMKKRQRAVALYFIDKLALRAGNEKEEGETADTVGCCSLRVEHIKLFPELDGQQYVVEFDFLGKDSIRYYNKVPVEKEVFKNLKLFMENKNPDDDLFDRLNTSIVNKHLQDLMDGLTAKVFRTYNASITLQIQLKALTNEDDNVPAKILSYNRANRAVALLCNHQRAPPKTFEKSMQNLQAKIDAKEQQVKDARKELKKAKADYKAHKNDRTKKEMEKKKKQCERLEEQLMKLKLQATDKEENKQIALGTSKLNYLDPRITVAWCKKYGVPIEKIYNKTQREKFAWAIDMTDEDFEF